MQVKELIERFAAEFSRYESVNVEHSKDGKAAIEFLCKEFMPSGSGFDSGTTFDFDKSRYNRFVFVTGFHHMNDAGFYDGWTQHSVIVEPDWNSFHVTRVTGRDKRGIKDYIGDTFHHCLMQRISAEWDSVNETMIYKSVGPADLPTNA